MKAAVLSLCLFCLALPGFADTHAPIAGSRVYVDAGNFTDYIVAALQSKHVPLIITVDRKAADYIITGTHVDSARALGMNHDAGSINLIDRSGDILWSKSVTRYGVADMRGEQTIAGSLAKHLKDFVAEK